MLKTPSKRAIKKIEDATGDLTGNKIANKIINESPPKSVRTVESETEMPKENIYLQNKGKKLLMN